MHLRASGRGKQIRHARRFAQRAQADQLRLMNRKFRLAAQKCARIQRGKAAVAADCRRDALQKRKHAGALAAVDMTVRIDKAGADKAAGCVEHLSVFRRVRGFLIDGGNAPVFAEHIRRKARQGFRIDDRSAGNEKF